MEELGWVTGTGGGISIRKESVLRYNFYNTATNRVANMSTWLHQVNAFPLCQRLCGSRAGVQKERILPEHIFVLPFAQSSIPKSGSKRDFVRIPPKQVSPCLYHAFTCLCQGLKESACTPLFWNAFTMRDAGACIHTHSQHAGTLRAFTTPPPHAPLSG